MIQEKYEWRKKEKYIYITKSKPSVIELPTQKFITIKGLGNPNSEEFKEKISSLYATSYAIRMSPKKGIHYDGYFEYTVYPLEGFWTIQEAFLDEEFNKDNLEYKIMLKQPEFVTKEVFEDAINNVKGKVSDELREELEFEEIDEGLVAQILHKGSFDDEAESFEKLEEFIKENGYVRISKDHKEIYLSDFRKVTTDKLKTILRVKIEK